MLTPEEERTITTALTRVRDRLAVHAFTSPLKAGLVAGGVGAVAALVLGKSMIRYGLVTGLLASAVASSWRSWYMAGYGCGLCEGMASAPPQLGAAHVHEAHVVDAPQ